MGLIIVLIVLLLYVDWCAWKIVRLPLSPFYLTRPFLISAILVSFAGYVCVPIFRGFKAINVIKRQGPIRHRLRKRTPTLGGLFSVPIGVVVALFFAGSLSIEVSGAAGVTIAFAAVGLLNDILSLTKSHRRGLPALAEVLLEVTTFFIIIKSFVFAVFIFNVHNELLLFDKNPKSVFAIESLAKQKAQFSFSAIKNIPLGNINFMQTSISETLFVRN